MKGDDQDEEGGQSTTQENTDEVGPIFQAIYKENSGYTKKQIETAREENDLDVVAGAMALMNIIHF